MSLTLLKWMQGRSKCSEESTAGTIPESIAPKTDLASENADVVALIPTVYIPEGVELTCEDNVEIAAFTAASRELSEGFEAERKPYPPGWVKTGKTVQAEGVPKWWLTRLRLATAAMKLGLKGADRIASDDWTGYAPALLQLALNVVEKIPDLFDEKDLMPPESDAFQGPFQIHELRETIKKYRQKEPEASVSAWAMSTAETGEGCSHLWDLLRWLPYSGASVREAVLIFLHHQIMSLLYLTDLKAIALGSEQFKESFWHAEKQDMLVTLHQQCKHCGGLSLFIQHCQATLTADCYCHVKSQQTLFCPVSAAQASFHQEYKA